MELTIEKPTKETVLPVLLGRVNRAFEMMIVCLKPNLDQFEGFNYFKNGFSAGQKVKPADFNKELMLPADFGKVTKNVSEEDLKCPPENKQRAFFLLGLTAGLLTKGYLVELGTDFRDSSETGRVLSEEEEALFEKCLFAMYATLWQQQACYPEDFSNSPIFPSRGQLEKFLQSRNYYPFSYVYSRLKAFFPDDARKTQDKPGKVGDRGPDVLFVEKSAQAASYFWDQIKEGRKKILLSLDPEAPKTPVLFSIRFPLEEIEKPKVVKGKKEKTQKSKDEKIERWKFLLTEISEMLSPLISEKDPFTWVYLLRERQIDNKYNPEVRSPFSPDLQIHPELFRRLLMEYSLLVDIGLNPMQSYLIFLFKSLIDQGLTYAEENNFSKEANNFLEQNSKIKEFLDAHFPLREGMRT